MRQIKAPCMFRSQCTGTTHNQHTQHTIDTLLSTYHNCIRTTDQTTSMPKPIAKQTRTMTTHTHFQGLTPRHVTLSLKIRSMDSPQSLNIGSTISPGAKEALSGPWQKAGPVTTTKAKATTRACGAATAPSSKLVAASAFASEGRSRLAENAHTRR